MIEFANTIINPSSIKFTYIHNDPSVASYTEFISKQISCTAKGSILKDLQDELRSYKPTYKIIIVFVDYTELCESFDSKESRDHRVETLQKYNVKYIK